MTATYDIDGFCDNFNVSRSTVYREIRSGRLQTIRCGRRTLITHDAADAWLHSLEEASREVGHE